MHKLKSVFGKKSSASASENSGSNSGMSTGSSGAAAGKPGVPSGKSTGNGDNAKGVIMHTNVGDIVIALYRDQTPKTCRNFATLAATGKYDNVIFHRIIAGFMIQGGDPTGTGRGGSSIYGAKFEDEIVPSLVHKDKGTLSMANSGPNTNGSQFFITLGATPHLNGKHTVFGHVAEGMDVVDKLGAVKTDSNDRPLSPVCIEYCEVF